jgi:hypothetical protein
VPERLTDEERTLIERLAELDTTAADRDARLLGRVREEA